MEEFYRTLFDEGELTCFGVTAYETRLSSATQGPRWSIDQFFVINPMHTDRRDSNVTALRTFLVEFDGGGLEEQAALAEELELPYTAIVYSGGKSLHYLITLSQPLLDPNMYRAIAKVIASKCGSDPACINPSRFSRTPNATRKDTGRVQELLCLKTRVDFLNIEAWLAKHSLSDEVEKLMARQSQYLVNVKGDQEELSLTGFSSYPDRARMPPFTKFFIDKGAPTSESKNKALYGAAKDAAKAGFSEQEIIELLEPAAFRHGCNPERIRNTIRSGIRAALHG